MANSLKRYAPVAAIVGLVGLVAALGVYLVQRQFNVYVQASLAVGLLALAIAILLDPQTVQAWAGRRQTRYGGNVALMIIALLAILIVGNYLVIKNVKQWDLTANKVNTLAPETVQALSQLSAPVKAIGFYISSNAAGQTQAKNLFEQYRAASGGKFTYEFHDPNAEPALANQYKIAQDATTVLVMNDHQESITSASEDQIDSALARLANPKVRKVYFLTGDGEHAIDGTDGQGLSSVVALLKSQNYDVAPLNLALTNTVPSDATAVVVAGPVSPLSSIESDLLQVYLEKGGAVVAMEDPLIARQQPLTATEPFVSYLAKDWGVKIGNDLVIDYYNSIQFQGQTRPDFPAGSTYGSSSIVSGLQNKLTVFPEARSVSVPAAGQEATNTTYSTLVNLDARAWGETNMSELSQSQGPVQDAGDTQPPLAVAVSAQNSQTKARLVVFGNSSFAVNGWMQQVPANGQLMTNAIAWATSDETLINVTPHTPTQLTLNVTNALTVNAVLVLVVIVMPLVVLVAGGANWFLRRRHI